MMKFLTICIFFISQTAIASAQSKIDALKEALQTKELIAILAEEGILQSQQMQDGALPNRTNSGWQRVVSQIYDEDRISEVFDRNFDPLISEVAAEALAEFYTSDIGQKVVKVEIEARRAIISEDVELVAKSAFEELVQSNPERHALLVEFADVNELIDRNVTGALNSNLAFFSGMASSSSFDMTEDQILNSVWAREPEIRMDTELWVFGYMTLAYGALSDEELSAYIDTARSEPGQELNRALFAGFNAVFDDVSFLLGKATSEFSTGDEL